MLAKTDEVGESVFCDVRFSFGEEFLWPWSFVVTLRERRIIGFEVFHPHVEGGEERDHYRLVWGQFKVRGRASEITAPRSCAWVFYKDEQGIPTSVRLYPTKAQALEAVKSVIGPSG